MKKNEEINQIAPDVVAYSDRCGLKCHFKYENDGSECTEYCDAIGTPYDGHTHTCPHGRGSHNNW